MILLNNHIKIPVNALKYFFFKNDCNTILYLEYYNTIFISYTYRIKSIT